MQIDVSHMAFAGESWAFSRPSAAGIVPSSIQELYLARSEERWSNRTVPAMNLRGWTYQTCRAVFRAARETGAHLLMFEQAVAGRLGCEEAGFQIFKPFEDHFLKGRIGEPCG